MSYYNLTDKTKQLDEEVLKYYFKEYKKGNLAARGILIEKNIRLVEAIIKKYSTYFDQDDLVQIGCVGLIKAVDTFDIDRCSKFSNYAGICIDNEIRMFLRKNYKYINIISIDDTNSKFIIDNMLSSEVADLVLEYEKWIEILLYYILDYMLINVILNRKLLINLVNQGLLLVEKLRILSVN